MLSINDHTTPQQANDTLHFLGNPIYWNPKFAGYALSNGQHIFLAEDAYFVCSEHQFQQVHHFLNEESSAFTSSPEMKLIYLVSQFKKAKILVNESLNIHYKLPNKEIRQQSTELGNIFISLSHLSSQPDLSFIIDQLNALFDARITTIIVDDFLDPRIEKVQQQLKQAWVIIKLTGRTISLSPVFNLNDPACFTCLFQHLQKNQGARQWAQLHYQHPIYIPTAVSANLKEQFTIFLAHVKKAIQQHSTAKLLSFSLQESEFSTHSIHPHPSCFTHGWRNNIETAKPILLQANPKVALQDGGYRTLTPEDSLKRLSPIISPLTGVITEVRALTENQDKLNVYGASFARFPKKNRGNQSFVYYALGKGISDTQSKMSALAEAIERYSAMYDGSETFISTTSDQLDAPALLPDQLKQYSETQFQSFQQQPNQVQAVRPYQERLPLKWQRVYSLINQHPYYVPFTACHSNTPFDDEQYVHFDSNGCASGNTLEEAILQGFLELIERDAVAVWWYNKIPRPAISLVELDQDATARLSNTLDAEWEYWLLDLTHDFKIPVVAAVGKHKVTQVYRLAFGAHLDAALACKRALTELYQIIVVGDQKDTAFNFGEIENHPFLLPNQEKARNFSDFHIINHPDLKDDLLYCLDRAQHLGFDVLVADLTKVGIPLHVAKVMIPNLNFIWPEFGNQRLYKLPVQLGWINKQLQESDLNNLSLFL